MSKQMSASAEKRVLDLARKGGILRPRDLQTKGLPKDYLWRSPQRTMARESKHRSAQSNRSHQIASCYDVAGGD